MSVPTNDADMSADPDVVPAEGATYRDVHVGLGGEVLARVPDLVIAPNGKQRWTDSVLGEALYEVEPDRFRHRGLRPPERAASEG